MKKLRGSLALKALRKKHLAGFARGVLGATSFECGRSSPSTYTITDGFRTDVVRGYPRHALTKDGGKTPAYVVLAA